RDDRLTPAERISLLTLWIVARSPLMIGGDLPSSDPTTIALFQNADVLTVLRDSSGGRELFREDDTVIWGADGAGGIGYAAVFNLADAPREIVLDMGSLALPVGATGVTELWTGRVIKTEPVAVQSNAARGVAPGSRAVRLDL